MKQLEDYVAKPDPVRFVRLKKVLERTSLSQSSLYKMMGEGRFPRPVKVSERQIAFIEHEVDAWIYDRIADRETMFEVALQKAKKLKEENSDASDCNENVN